MSKDKFALAYSVKRLAKARAAAAPVAINAPEPQEELPIEDSILDEEQPRRIDLKSIIKKHRFFRSK